MRIKIILIALVSFILIIWSVGADPVIKKVKLTPTDDPKIFDVTIGATDSEDKIKEVITNNDPLANPTSGTNEEWNGRISMDNDGIMNIQAKNTHNIDVKKQFGSGSCPGSYDAHTQVYGSARVYPVPITGIETTFYLDTDDEPGASIIGICVYPDPGYDPDEGILDIAAPLIGKWVPKHSGTQDYFGFGRIKGEDKILLNGDDNIEIGTANYGLISQDSQRILMHIDDSSVCGLSPTCWRRPGTTQIPEFPTIALPIAAVIGLVFFFQQRKK